MPFRVSQWPYAPDPRSPAFGIAGYDFGQVPPWAFIVKTSAATGSMAIFNAGVLTKSTTGLVDQVVYESPVVLPNGVTIEFLTNGFQEPVGPPPLSTMFMTIIIREYTAPTWTGSIGLLYPKAIQVQGPLALSNVGPSAGSIPNPMLMTPAKWDA